MAMCMSVGIKFVMYLLFSQHPLRSDLAEGEYSILQVMSHV